MRAAKISRKNLTKEQIKEIVNFNARVRAKENYLKLKLRRENNKEKIKEYKKDYSSKPENKIKKANYNKLWVENNKEKYKKRRREYEKRRKEENPLYRLKSTIVGLISSSFSRNKKSLKKSEKTEKILGCTIEFFIDYILNYNGQQFLANDFGITGFHIDHIIPISLAKTEEEVIKLCHYTNLRPLYYKDNIEKSNKLI